MFFISNGTINIHPGASTLKVWENLRKTYSRRKKYLRDLSMYLLYVYGRKINGYDNDFRHLPPRERKRSVVDQLDLFEFKKPSRDRDISSIESNGKVEAFIEWYTSIQYSDNERNCEVFREKEEHWRDAYKASTSWEEDEKNAKALEHAVKWREHYQHKADAEEAVQEMDGRHYLFEVPVNQDRPVALTI